LAAPGHPPNGFDATASDAHYFLVQVDRGVGIADDQLDFVANPGCGAWMLQFDLGMLGRELHCADRRHGARRRHRRIATHFLLTGVDDDTRRRRSTRDRRQDSERRRKVDMVVRAVVHIAENGATDLHFGYAGLLCAVRKGARAAAAHHRDAVAGGHAGPGAGGKCCDGIADRALLLRTVGDRRSLALPTHYANEAETPATPDLARQCHHRRAWFDARAIHADIDLDRDAQPPGR